MALHWPGPRPPSRALAWLFPWLLRRRESVLRSSPGASSAVVLSHGSCPTRSDPEAVTQRGACSAIAVLYCPSQSTTLEGLTRPNPILMTTLHPLLCIHTDFVCFLSKILDPRPYSGPSLLVTPQRLTKCVQFADAWL